MILWSSSRILTLLLCCAGGKAKPLKQPKAEKKEYDEVLIIKDFFLYDIVNGFNDLLYIC